MLFVATLLCLTASGQENSNVLSKYTKENPLVIAADWDFPPYEYRDNQGQPSGYNVDVISTMLSELNVPYVYVMKEWSKIQELFQNGEADLIISPVSINRMQDCHYSRATLGAYRIVIAHKADVTPPKNMEQLMASDSLTTKQDDHAAQSLIAFGKTITEDNLCLPRKGLRGVVSGKYKYYLWGEKPLEWFVKEQNLSEIKLTVTDIPAAHIRMVSKNKELIDALDDKFVRMDQSGVIVKLHNKWLHPELADDDESSVSLYIIFAFAILIVLFLMFNHLLSKRLKKKEEEFAEKGKIMQEALQASNCMVVVYDLKKRTIWNKYGNFIPKKQITFSEYNSNVHTEDREKLRQFIEDLLKSDNKHITESYRWNRGTEEQPDWRNILDQSVVEYDSNGKPITFISTLIDVTEELRNEQAEKEILEKYSKVFNMSLVGLALYDKNGVLLNTNNKMREIFKFKHPKDELFYNTKLSDLPFIDDKKGLLQQDELHLCTRKCLIPQYDVSKYIEIRICQIKDEAGQTAYILVTAQDIKEEYMLHMKQKENDVKIRKVNREISRYQEELRYLLQESNMRVWRSSFDTKEVNFYKDLDCSELSYSFDKLIENTDGEENKIHIKKIIGIQRDLFRSHKAILPIKNLSVNDDTIHWYSINSLTDYDGKGNAIGCFGLIRDITQLVRAQEMLKEETIRANNSKHQKSVFLANMTHEIRTPLNAIVGFCDLLQAIDSPDDRKEFIRIIRNNCNMLLHLINDILAVSTIDIRGLSITPRDVDFAQLFNDTCATLSQQVPDPNAVQFIKENPYSSLIANIDRNRIEQIITNFTTNAIKHTQKGHIRVGYRIENDGIYIYCEDTGNGIPKEKCEDVFKRFVKLNDYVQGTGLGLSICKAIADACEGKIGVESDTGLGAKFWFWLPCDIKTMQPQ